MLEQLTIDGIGEETANIASPPKEFFKLLSEAVVELRFPERHLCNVLCAHEILVPFTRGTEGAGCDTSDSKSFGVAATCDWRLFFKQFSYRHPFVVVFG